MNHVHGAINHFPIALLFVSVGFDLFAGKRSNLRFSAWLLLALGAIGAVASTVSGLVAHLAYEDDPILASAIEVPVHGLRRDGHLCRARGLALVLFAARLGHRGYLGVPDFGCPGSDPARRHRFTGRQPPHGVGYRRRGRYPMIWEDW